MKCAVHTEVDAAGFCRNCGKSLCAECTRDVRGILYCEGCLATLVSKPQPAPGSGNAALAAVLGCIPGLGAVYNGEYVKAAIHLMIFGGLISLADRSQDEAVFVMLAVGFYFYMPFEAYRTAKAKAMGKTPADFITGATGKQPIGPIALIVLGALLLLSNLHWINLDRIADFWPVLLIALGIWLMRRRMQPAPPSEEPPHEQR